MLDSPSENGGSKATETDKSYVSPPPAVSLPKGGGAIKGMGEKFAANPVNQLNSVSSCMNELEHLSFKIISEFCIKNSQFLIFSLSEYNEERQNSTLSLSTDALHSSTVGSFEVDGICYLILKTQNTPENLDLTLINRLTERELQIATLTALGKSNRQIANHLHISEWTVSAHLRRIFIKLNVDSRAAMVYRCASLIDQVDQLSLMLHKT